MSEKKIIVPEAMRKAFGRGTQDLDPEGYLAFHGLEQVVLWLNDILHPANADFHRAILKREQERYPDEVINGVTSGMVISYRVAFEYGASFARNYISDLFHAPEPQVPKEIQDLLAKADIHEYHPVEKERVVDIVLKAYRLGRNSKESH